MTVKELKGKLENFADDLIVVVDVSDFGQEPITSVEVTELYRGDTAHGKAYYENQDFFMGNDVTKEKVVYLCGE